MTTVKLMFMSHCSQVFMETMNIKVVTTSKKDTIDNLMRLADLHDLLNTILGKVNRCYAIQVDCITLFGLAYKSN